MAGLCQQLQIVVTIIMSSYVRTRSPYEKKGKLKAPATP